MHQSLTNTTWSPETHSSTKNASVFLLSPLLSFRLCHLSTSSISLQSDTRALSSILQNNHFPVCFRGKDVATIYEDLTLIYPDVIHFVLSGRLKKRKRKTEQHTKTLHLFRPVLLNLPAGLKLCIQAVKAVFINGNCWVNACWGFLSHQLSQVLLWDKSAIFQRNLH